MAHFFLAPPTGALGRAKRSNIKFQFLSQFQIFLNQTLCVFSQMKDIKHIRWDFHSVAWVMPQGPDLRGYKGREGEGVKKYFFPEFNQIWCSSNLHEWHMQRHKFFGPPRTKILDGIHQESKRFPSEKITDLRKSWRNTPGHVLFSKSRRTLCL